MSVLIDTSVWSLVLRRSRPLSPYAEEVARLLRTGTAVLLGVVRQELLSGIADRQKFVRLRDKLRALDDYPVTSVHYETAAESFNVCRAHGVQGTMVDLLVCAVAMDEEIPIYTTDRDYLQYAKHLPIQLHHP
jgi:predicted nucleic acid-binding protein